MSLEVALIPPISLLEWTDLTKYQLMLPHLMGNDQYKYTYKKHCKDVEKIVIMDNGAAEGEPVTHEQLFYYAMEYLPNEIVLPDTLGSRRDTVEKSREFLDKYGTAISDAAITPGFVAQGFDVEDSFNGVCEFARDCNFGTVYIPRALNTSPHHTARLEVAEAIVQEFGDTFEIHFLGASIYWPREVASASVAEHVRSLDTSMPFNYAHAVKSFFSKAQVARPANYFDLPAEDFPNVGIRVREYMTWAR